jgi:outer membrane protein OmpA-like peptidoglycan-associated protein
MLRDLSGAVLLALLSLPAAALTYMAPLDRAAWQVEQSKLSCRLRQAIPKYGDAVFEARAGGRQQFFLAPVKNPMRSGAALLVASAPAWNPELAPHDLGTVTVADGQRPVQLDDALSQRILQVLNHGLVPELTSPSRAVAAVSVRVGLSPARFRAAYGKYLECVSQLPAPVSTARTAADTTVLNFGIRDTRLDGAARDQLDLLVRHIKTAGGSADLLIDALSTDTPRRLENLNLAKRRAHAVSDYLIAGGVAQRHITSRYRGEHNPQRRGIVTIKLRRR